jgi:hypothetical protein
VPLLNPNAAFVLTGSINIHVGMAGSSECTQVEEHVSSGALQRLLRDRKLESMPVYVVYPLNRHFIAIYACSSIG